MSGVRVYVSIGTNIDREHHVAAALDALADTFGELLISPVYESEAVGFDGAPFYNLVVGLDTDWTVGRLSRYFKALEARHGRSRDVPRFSARTLDLDILTYGTLGGVIEGVQLPRAEILRNAFVLRPLADLAPEERHPVCGRRYRELWQEYREDQKLWPVDFRWRGRWVSHATG